ncbi:trehalase family glycosidase [Tsuneonella rigui]|uniref:trehalase family glycosidase n=1 Tax=Tsuneonella rigui TaxID=1708790 RepID=UPI000F7E7649
MPNSSMIWWRIESPQVGSGGEYAPQVGFGWTNGVTADFIDDLGAADHRAIS